jgi:hypothetical protein
VSTLLTEAERRYLAAALDNPDLAIEQITAADFAHPGYAAVYQAVFDLHQEQPELAGTDLARAAADRAAAPGLDADRLDRLREEAPGPDQVPHYASMIVDASFQREMAVFAARASGDFDEHATRVNNAIIRHAEHYQKLFDTPWPDQATAAEAPEATGRLGQEELLVASLMAYPEQVRELVAIVPPESVEDLRCRVAYETVASAAWDGDYIDDVGLVWSIAKAQEMNAGLEGTPVSYTEPDAAFIARLARTEITEHTGLDTARQLLAADASIAVTPSATQRPSPDPTVGPEQVFHPANQIHQSVPPPDLGSNSRPGHDGGA